MLGYDTKVLFFFGGKFEIIGLACFQSVDLKKKPKTYKEAYRHSSKLNTKWLKVLFLMPGLEITR